MVSMLLASALTNAGIHHRSPATPPPSFRNVNVSLFMRLHIEDRAAASPLPQ